MVPRLPQIPVISLIVVFCTVILLSGCAPEEDPAGPGNSLPVIQRITVSPDSVTPGGTVSLSCLVSDADELDSLVYAWSAEEGTFTGVTDGVTATWTAPGRLGRFAVYLSLSDGTATVRDTVEIPVYSILSVDITLPLAGAVFTPGDTITFRGRLQGHNSMTIGSSQVAWESDVDGLLNTSPPDTTGLLTFRTPLSYDVHRVSLTVTLNDTLTVSDTVLVNNNQPAPVTLYDIERGYTFNRLTWTRFNDPTRFFAYHVVRTPLGGSEETIALRLTDTDTVYVDSLVEIGRTYSYRILAENSFGITAASNARSFATGVFRAYDDTYIGDMTFTSNSHYLYLSLADRNEVSVLDVTSNNVDFTVSTRARPFGLAYNGDDHDLYVANSGDTTLTVINLANWTVRETINLPRRPLFLDINDFRSQIVITTVTNNYPIFIRTDPFQGRIIGSIVDSRLLVDSSLVLIDDDRDRLYLSEIGGFPASLYQYGLTGTNPQLIAESEHNSIGYNIRDMAIAPNGTELLLACYSPFEVQILSTTGLSRIGSLNTGPHPNAVELSPDGRYAFTANGGQSVQMWDYASRTLLRTFRFSRPVARGAIRVSPNGRYLIVGTWNRTGNDSVISIIYME